MIRRVLSADWLNGHHDSNLGRLAAKVFTITPPTTCPKADEPLLEPDFWSAVFSAVGRSSTEANLLCALSLDIRGFLRRASNLIGSWSSRGGL